MTLKNRIEIRRQLRTVSASLDRLESSLSATKVQAANASPELREQVVSWFQANKAKLIADHNDALEAADLCADTLRRDSKLKQMFKRAGILGCRQQGGGARTPEDEARQ